METCLYCGIEYDTEATIGQWPCRYHPAEGTSPGSRYACCGTNPNDVQPGWLLRGCTPCDHTPVPWPTVHQPVLRLAFQSKAAHGRLATIDTPARLQTWLSQTIKGTPPATLPMDMCKDGWRVALQNHAPAFFDAVAQGIAPDVDRVMASSTDTWRAVMQEVDRETRQHYPKLSTPLVRLLALGPGTSTGTFYRLLAETLRWVWVERSNPQLNHSFLADGFVARWTDTTREFIDALPSLIIIPFYVVRRVAPGPESSALEQGRHQRERYTARDQTWTDGGGGGCPIIITSG